MPSAVARSISSFLNSFRSIPRQSGFTEKMSRAKAVSLDQSNRTFADLLLPDGMKVYQALVKQGWCWWYRRYAPGYTVMEGLKKEPREVRKELWADPQPMPQ